MTFAEMLASAPPLQETIAAAIFEARHEKKSWASAKVNDQWLAVGSFDEAAAVLVALGAVGTPVMFNKRKIRKRT